MTGRKLTPAEKARYRKALRLEHEQLEEVHRLEKLYSKAAKEVLDAPDEDWSEDFFIGVRNDILELVHAAREEYVLRQEATTLVLAEVRGVF